MSQCTARVLAMALMVGISGSPAWLLAQAPASIETEPTSLTLEVGEKAQVKAVVKDADGNILPDAQILFFSRDRRKLGVTPSGWLEPFLPGGA